MGRTKDVLCFACGSFMTTIPIDVDLDKLDITPVCETERCRSEHAEFYKEHVDDDSRGE
jgi:hypothetical protein